MGAAESSRNLGWELIIDPRIWPEGAAWSPLLRGVSLNGIDKKGLTGVGGSKVQKCRQGV